MTTFPIYSYIPITFILVMSSCFMSFKHIRSISAYSHPGADRIHISTRPQEMGQMFEHPIFYLLQDDCRHIYIYTMIYIIYIIISIIRNHLYFYFSDLYIYFILETIRHRPGHVPRQIERRTRELGEQRRREEALFGASYTGRLVGFYHSEWLKKKKI